MWNKQADAIILIARDIDPKVEVRRTEGRTGVRRKGAMFDFVWLEPDACGAVLSIRLPEAPEMADEIAAEDIDTLPYDHLEQAYRLVVRDREMISRFQVIWNLIMLAHRECLWRPVHQ